MRAGELNREQILEMLVERIADASNIEYQKRVWIEGRGPECDSFIEFVCYFFPQCEYALNSYKTFEIKENQLRLLKTSYEELRIFSDEEESRLLKSCPNTDSDTICSYADLTSFYPFFVAGVLREVGFEAFFRGFHRFAADLPVRRANLAMFFKVDQGIEVAESLVDASS